MTISKSSPAPAATKSVRKNTDVESKAVSEPARAVIKISTVSHTLDTSVAERLRHFAFRERISESAVIEYAVRTFFSSGEEATLGTRLREAGAALRRKS